MSSCFDFFFQNVIGKFLWLSSFSERLHAATLLTKESIAGFLQWILENCCEHFLVNASVLFRPIQSSDSISQKYCSSYLCRALPKPLISDILNKRRKFFTSCLEVFQKMSMLKFSFLNRICGRFCCLLWEHRDLEKVKFPENY